MAVSTEPAAAELSWQEKPARRIPDEAIDVGAVAVLTLIGLLGFGASFGGWLYLVVGVTGLLVGITIAVLSIRYGQPGSFVAAVSLFVLVALAAAVALRATALAGVLPTLETVRGLAQGITGGWRELVTTPPPVGNFGNLLAIPYVCGFVGGVAGAWGALRSSRLWWGLTPPALVLAAGIMTGTAIPVSLLLQGGLFAAIAIGWAVARSRRVREVISTGGRAQLRPWIAAAVVIGCAAVAIPVGPRLPGADANPRFLLSRYVEPEFDPRQFPSPLTAVRNDLIRNKEADLFTVEGLAPGDRLRIAVLNDWDGTATLVAGGPDDLEGGSFRQVADAIPASETGETRSINLRILQNSYVWVPTVGALRSVATGGPRSEELRSAFRYNTVTDTAVAPVGLLAGDEISFDAVVATQPSQDELSRAAAATVRLPAIDSLPPKLAQAGRAYLTQAATPYVRAQEIAQGLAQEFYTFEDSGRRTPPGHGSKRLNDMLRAKEVVGDEEQYGALAMLMAREVDVPARLVLGYTPEVGADGAPVTVRGADVAVWLEVALDGLGWVTLADPITPERDNTPDQDLQQQQNPKPEVQLPPPPVADVAQPPLASGGTAEDTEEANPSGGGIPGWLQTVAVGVLLPTLLLAAFVGIILGLKRRRAQRRRSALDPSHALTGGWREFLDWTRDHRLAVPDRGTRTETASVVSAAAPQVASTAVQLASGADRAAFGPDQPTQSEIDAYWADVESAQLALEQDLGFWARWRARLSLRSLMASGLGTLTNAVPVRRGGGRR
jgi:transglutaminase-like putative cysteine protease/MFS family permease